MKVVFELEEPELTWDFVGDVGAGMGAPVASGIIRTCPTTRAGSVRLFAATIESALTLYCVASASRVSPAFTVTMRPFMGGMTRRSPTLRSVFEVMWFAQ